MSESSERPKSAGEIPQSEYLERVVRSRARLMERFKQQIAQSPAMSDEAPQEDKARDQRRAQREILIRLLCFVLGIALTFLLLR